MGSLTQWFTNTLTNIFESSQEQRVQELADVLQRYLEAHRQNFSLAAVLAAAPHERSDVTPAKERVLRRIMQRGWADEQFTADEVRVAHWVAQKLEITPDRVAAINVELARELFGAALAQAMEDGVLDAAEERRLDTIAGSINCTTAQLAGRFFQADGARFLQAMFADIISDDKITSDEWRNLLATAKKLGVSHDAMLAAVRPQATRFAERVLADAKSDCRLSDKEEATLTWIVSQLDLGERFFDYLNEEVAELRRLTQVRDGVLPSLPPLPIFALKAGEIVHYHGPAILETVKQLKTGPKTEHHAGHVVLTDNRLVHAADTRSIDLGYRQIVSHRLGRDRIEVLSSNKPMHTFVFMAAPTLPYAVLETAVASVNQIKLARSEDNRSRRIPRDVRQRVWARCGGKCVECSAADYLEFDHIVPFSRGGANSDQNVELLCRRCNLKKSDDI